VTPRPRAKYRGLGPGVDRADRHAEAHPVDGRDVPVAEGLDERHAPVDVEQPLVGGGDRLGAHVVLADPRQPVGRQRRDAGVGDLGEADVARFGQQYRADADGQILGAGEAFAEVGKRIGKPGPAAHLQQHLGERDACGEHAGCGRAQRAELLGLLQRLETCHVGAVRAGELGDLQRDVLGQALGGLPVGAVELDADPLERLPRIGLKIEPGADVPPARPSRRSR
jgi:hypothetical protein